MSGGKYPFWLVKIRSNEWIKADLSNNYMSDGAVTTALKSEAARFGLDMARTVASFHKNGDAGRARGRVVKITGPGKKKIKPVHLAMIIDGSGSMTGVAEPTKQAYNEIIEATKTQAKKNSVPTRVTQVTFGANTGRLGTRHWGLPMGTGVLSCEVKEDFNSVPVESVPLFRYSPYGNTPLLDAVGYTIDRLKSITGFSGESFLVQVITDGEENASSKYTKEAIQRMLKDCQDAGNWTFVFHLPPGHKDAFVRNYGIPAGNCREWERTAVGLRDLSRATGASTQSYYAQTSKGATATRGFFEVDLADVKTTDIKRNLKDVSGKLIKLNVTKEMAIKEFVEKETGGPYRAGDSFFALTKDEKLASHKKLIVQEKGSSAMYYGDEARKVLGLPAATPFTEVKLRPRNLSTFDLFIQSNSQNRRLVRGTRLLVLKTGETL